MSLEALSILFYALLIFGGVAVQAVYLSRTSGPAFGFSNRVDTPPGANALGHRIDRTLANLKEGAIMYLPLALLVVSLDISNGWTRGAAVVTILSRGVYVPVFYLGIPVLRTCVWTPGFLAVIAMAAGLVVGVP